MTNANEVPERIWVLPIKKYAEDDWSFIGYDTPDHGGTECIRMDVSDAAVAAEREACARIVDEYKARADDREQVSRGVGKWEAAERHSGQSGAGVSIASAIRARGDTDALKAYRRQVRAEVIEASNIHLVKRLKALQTYFDLSDEELDAMTRDERADCVRQHRLIAEALAGFNEALIGEGEE